MSQIPLKQVNRKNAAQDIVEAIRLYRTWAFLSYQDIISRYRRSIIGPFWVAGMMITQAIAMSLVFGGIYKVDLKEFLPYVVSGLTIVIFISSAFGEGAETFGIYRSVMTAHNLPISFHIFRMCCRQFVIFLHNFVVFVAVYAIFGNGFGVNFFIFPAILIDFVFLFSCTLLCATLSLRFKDFKFILPHLWTITFYLTPVIWKPSQINQKYAFIYEFNPIYYILEITRSSMMGHTVPVNIWLGAVAISLSTLALAYLVFAMMRRKMALWL